MNDQEYYSLALEKLRPLRYHLNKLLECPSFPETDNTKAFIISNEKEKAAKDALEEVEDFFLNRNNKGQ